MSIQRHASTSYPWAIRLFALGLLFMMAKGMAAGIAENETTLAGDTSRYRDFEQIKNGRKVYLNHCAVCHGPRAEGNSNWRYRDQDGMFPPPPLNGNGHTWHHSLKDLQQMILKGSPKGQGRMPAWEGILSSKDVEDVITWFQFLWPEAVYLTWREIDIRSQQTTKDE